MHAVRRQECGCTFLPTQRRRTACALISTCMYVVYIALHHERSFVKKCLFSAARRAPPHGVRSQVVEEVVEASPSGLHRTTDDLRRNCDFCVKKKVRPTADNTEKRVPCEAPESARGGLFDSWGSLSTSRHWRRFPLRPYICMFHTRCY